MTRGPADSEHTIVKKNGVDTLHINSLKEKKTIAFFATIEEEIRRPNTLIKSTAEMLRTAAFSKAIIKATRQGE